ncbi:hypothetical protein [Bacillus sp. AFS088145]|uniref:hypothetical protein n=1 Tax=Bacillus sp. AFS088145 TaxID=2033514 RepID=UPI000BF832A4|nr:hypothetical protein [Bacillus sp. AFS088145]PFH87246.1 hypothetical protein COI44_11100 [Bacillus sp. AFS088145]
MAFIVTSAENAKELSKTPFFIDGAGYYTSGISISQSEMVLFHQLKSLLEMLLKWQGLQQKMWMF